LDTKTVEVNGQRVHLTGKEYQMLELLSLRKGTTLTKEMFLNHLYGGMDEPELKIIDVFICKLRKKLQMATGGHHYIETVWGRRAQFHAAPDPERAKSRRAMAAQAGKQATRSSGFKAAIVSVTPFQQNCTLVWDGATKVGAVVDPGGDIERVRAAIAQVGMTVEKIILTHGHIDHAGGAADLRDALDVAIEGPHEADEFLLEGLEAQGRAY